MFFINKISGSRRDSSAAAQQHDERDTRHSAPMPPAEFAAFAAAQATGDVPRPKSSWSNRHSKNGRSSLFSRRRSAVDHHDENDCLSPTAPRRTLTEKQSMNSLTSGPRRHRTLRKMSSKTSVLSHESAEERPVSRAEQLLGRSVSQLRSSSSSSRMRTTSISQPFNFTHLSHSNNTSLKALPAQTPDEISNQWNRAIRDSHLSRPLTAKASMPTMHVREQSDTGFSFRERAGSTLSVAFSPRARANSVMTLSPAGTPMPTESPQPSPTFAPGTLHEPERPAYPVTPPLRAAQRHCLSITEQPEYENSPAHDAEIPAVDLTDYDQEELAHAMTTDGDLCYGSKFAGIERVISNTSVADSGIIPSPPLPPTFEPLFDDDRFPDLELSPRGTRSRRDSTPTSPTSPASPGSLMPPFNPTGNFLSVRARPLSQMSAHSDTLNGNFAVPPGPRARRADSRRLSTLRRSPAAAAAAAPEDPTADWEQDIDWCYENEGDADDWDNQSVSDAINSVLDELAAVPVPVAQLQPQRRPTPAAGPPVDLARPRTAEKRITGLFEDKLLLPPSPGFPSSPRLSIRRAGVDRDSGFESVRGEDVLGLRSPTSSVRHRSITLSPSMPNLAMYGSPRRYSARDSCASFGPDMCSIAKQLDEHIAALNKECLVRAAADDAPGPADRPLPTFTIRTRTRANSIATTCATLCSDSDTVLAADPAEAITPASSAHNSFHFVKPRSTSVAGAGMAVESRMEKTLSFPAAAMPGVIEVGPDCPFQIDEPEFVHFF